MMKKLNFLHKLYFDVNAMDDEIKNFKTVEYQDGNFFSNFCISASLRNRLCKASYLHEFHTSRSIIMWCMKSVTSE